MFANIMSSQVRAAYVSLVLWVMYVVVSATGTMYPSTTCHIWADTAFYARRKDNQDVVFFSKHKVFEKWK